MSETTTIDLGAIVDSGELLGEIRETLRSKLSARVQEESTRQATRRAFDDSSLMGIPSGCLVNFDHELMTSIADDVARNVAQRLVTMDVRVPEVPPINAAALVEQRARADAWFQVAEERLVELAAVKAALVRAEQHVAHNLAEIQRLDAACASAPRCRICGKDLLGADSTACVLCRADGVTP